MTSVVVILNIIASITLWGTLLYYFRKIISVFVKYLGKYIDNKEKIHNVYNYLDACIDSLFFLIPNVTWIQENNIIPLISNESFLIESFIFEVAVILLIFPYNFINLLRYLYLVKCKKLLTGKEYSYIYDNKKVDRIIFKKDCRVKHYFLYYFRYIYINYLNFNIFIIYIILFSLIFYAINCFN